MGETNFNGTKNGKHAVIRSGTIIYRDVMIGDHFQSGHNVMIREKTRIGNHIAIGTATVIEGNPIIGDEVNLQSMVYIPTDTVIGNHVFVGPNTVLTNDRYPPEAYWRTSRTADKGWRSNWCECHTAPRCLHKRWGARIDAGAIVTREVPAYMLTNGAPAKITALHLKIIRDITKK
jgi:acetyltransferase-like isoleucine patch superfamily enzyme